MKIKDRRPKKTPVSFGSVNCGDLIETESLGICVAVHIVGAGGGGGVVNLATGNFYTLGAASPVHLLNAELRIFS